MAKRKSHGEPNKSAQPARRSSRNSDASSGVKASSSSSSSAKKGQKLDAETTAIVPTKKAKTSNVPSYHSPLNFDEAQAVRFQEECSEFFYALPKAIVVSILFSGYFDTLFILLKLRPTCRAMYAMARNNVRLLDFHLLRLPGNCIVEQLVSFERLGFVDLSWADMSSTILFKDHGNVLARHVKTLKGLSLRDTSVGRDKETILGLVQLSNLEYLDLSKPSRRHLSCFREHDLQDLRKLEKLVWLNLSGNAISDLTVISICSEILTLRHVGLACCPISSQVLEFLSNLPLQTLDINGCKKITDDSFADLLNIRTSRCAQNIETLLCSFLHLPTRVTSNLLLDLPCLRAIEMRRTAVCPSVAKTLSSKLEIAIFCHTDQLEHRCIPDMYNRYGMNEVMDCLSWPYTSHIEKNHVSW